MKITNLFTIVALLLSLTRADAQGLNAGPQVPAGGANIAGFINCVAGVCTFTGADGSTQMAVGNINSAVEYVNVLGGVVGGGASIVCRNAAQSGNVNCVVTAQNSGNVVYGNNGHGTMAVVLDPGANSVNPVQMTPATASGSPVKVGNSAGGVNLDCGSSNQCQAASVPLGFHDVQTFFTAGTFTWTAKANITWVRAKGCGSGGAGGSGALTASGTASSGGAGGAGGGCFDETFRASDLGSSLNVFVGAGAVSVAGQTTNSTAGLNGGAGVYTCIGGASASPNSAGSVICGGGGGGGAGGQISATSGGGGGGNINGVGGNSTSATGASSAFALGGGSGGTGLAGGSTSGVGSGAGGAGASVAGVANIGGSSLDACGAGGSGGGVSTVPASNNGGGGGIAFRAYKQVANPAGGTVGTPTGGSITPQFPTFPGFGGGGGYGNSAGVGGAGGAGTQCGGGGGGGSALNGSTAGASGKGGDGWMEVTSW